MNITNIWIVFTDFFEQIYPGMNPEFYIDTEYYNLKTYNNNNN